MVENELIKIKQTELSQYPHLKPKSEWYRQGLRVKSDVKPKYYAYQKFTGDIYYLYEEDQCVPKRKISEKQLQQAIINLDKSRTCILCGELYPSYWNLNKEKKCCKCLEIQRIKEMRKEFAIKFKYWFAEKEKYLILDTETTGLDYDDEIIEIGIIDLEGITKFYKRIKPTNKGISNEAYQVHGISEDMLIDQPSFSDIFNELIQVIENKTLLIFNNSFDLRMIQQSCNEVELKQLKNTVYDSECMMSIITTYLHNEKWCSLQESCEMLGLEMKQTHNVIDDCTMVLELIKTVIKLEI